MLFMYKDTSNTRKMTFFNFHNFIERVTNNKRKRSLVYLFWTYFWWKCQKRSKISSSKCYSSSPNDPMYSKFGIQHALGWRTKVVLGFLKFLFFGQILGQIGQYYRAQKLQFFRFLVKKRPKMKISKNLNTIFILRTKILKYTIWPNLVKKGQFSVFSIIVLFSIISLITRAPKTLN